MACKRSICRTFSGEFRSIKAPTRMATHTSWVRSRGLNRLRSSRTSCPHTITQPRLQSGDFRGHQRQIPAVPPRSRRLVDIYVTLDGRGKAAHECSLDVDWGQPAARQYDAVSLRELHYLAVRCFSLTGVTCALFADLGDLDVRPIRWRDTHLSFQLSPIGWALYDGQLLAISQNTALFLSLVGTFYGGNGTSNFALPNLQGNVPMDSGNGAGLSQRFIGETGGESSLTLLQSEIPSHSHTLNGDTSTGTSTSPAAALIAAAGRSIPRTPHAMYVSSAGNTNMRWPETCSLLAACSAQ